jgi:signal transduction histidine kinase
MGNSSELTRLFQNLIGNAVKYRAAGRTPRIAVSLRPGPGCGTVVVEDNGIGIEAKEFENIFGIFHRLQPGREQEGTGIGLAVCRKIVQHQGGRIWVESEPGKGSRFCVSFPACVEPAAAEPAPAEPVYSGAALAK